MSAKVQKNPSRNVYFLRKKILLIYLPGHLQSHLGQGSFRILRRCRPISTQKDGPWRCGRELCSDSIEHWRPPGPRLRSRGLSLFATEDCSAVWFKNTPFIAENNKSLEYCLSASTVRLWFGNFQSSSHPASFFNLQRKKRQEIKPILFACHQHTD